MKIHAYIVLDDITLPDGESSMARAAGGEWYTMPPRNGRAIVEVVEYQHHATFT